MFKVTIPCTSFYFAIFGWECLHYTRQCFSVQKLSQKFNIIQAKVPIHLSHPAKLFHLGVWGVILGNCETLDYGHVTRLVAVLRGRGRVLLLLLLFVFLKIGIVKLLIKNVKIL